MSDWVDAVAINAVAPGGCEVFELDDVQLAIFNIDGEFFAIENVCTHDGGEIAGGCIINGTIECPRHGARFDLKTGAVVAPPAYEPITTFPVRVLDGVVQVRDARWD